MSVDFRNMLNTAIEAARQTGVYLMENLGGLAVNDINEKRRNDFVTIVDQTSEKIIIEHIHNRFPGHSILAEESGKSGQNSPFQWIIDPLDGTTNFIRKIPFFCVSIAVKYQQQVVAGVVYNPAQEELFTAVKGQGAFLNGESIRVSSQADFSRAFLATGFPHHAKYYVPQFIRAFSEIFFYTAGVRRLGSAALDLCYTAGARFDGFWELGLNSWDIAAGGLIVQEAGGMVSDFQGGANFLESGYVIAANPRIHPHLKDILSNYFKET